MLKNSRINVWKFVVCFLLGDSPASEFYIPTFRNTLFHLHRQVGACRINSARDMFGVFGSFFPVISIIISNSLSKLDRGVIS